MSDVLKIQKSGKFDNIYRGTVVYNNDPLKLGRVKVQVYPMLSDIQADDLPWAVPGHGIVCGAGPSTGVFAVPDVGSNVFVFFEAGNIYQPVYLAEAPDGVKGLPSEKDTNYPNRRGFKTSSGFVVYIDDTEKTLHIEHPKGTTITLTDEPRAQLEHPSGSYLIFDENGVVQVHAADNLEVTVVGNMSATVTGDMDVQATGAVTIQGATVSIN